MTYQKSLKVGDIIKISKHEDAFAVIRSEHRISHDSARGDSYWVDEIDVIAINIESILGTSGAPGLTHAYNPTPKSFYFEGGCMSGKGTKIKDTDITVIGTSKIETKVEVQYRFSKTKIY